MHTHPTRPITQKQGAEFMARIRATCVGVYAETTGEIDIIDALRVFLPNADPGSIREVLGECESRIMEIEVAAAEPCGECSRRADDWRHGACCSLCAEFDGQLHEIGQHGHEIKHHAFQRRVCA